MILARRRFLQGLFLLAIAPRAAAGSLESITGPEATQAVRDTLERGARSALAKLGKEDGYFANPQVRIGLPRNFRKADRILRELGQGKKVDDLVLAMNRAAEAAAPQAQELVVDAVKKMTVEDAKSILAGGDSAATDYFRKATEAQLAEKLLPVIKSVTERSNLARAYDAIAAKLVQLAGINSELSTVENYVNEKALKGIYVLIGEEERSIRSDPARYAGSVLGKVFGLLKR
jgi:hypothetical protein